MRQPKLVAAITNVSMSKGHKGLTEVAKKFGFNFEKLDDNQVVLFINKQRDKLKMLGAKGIVLGYVRMPSGRRLPNGAIQFIPLAFSGEGKIDVEQAIDAYINKTMETRALTHSPVNCRKV